MAAKKPSTDALVKQLRAFGLRYPGAHTKSPWPGHMDLAVKDKTFAFMSAEGEPFSMSCKLPESSLAALSLPHASPTGYGLGKSGWVNLQAPDGEAPPLELLKAWIDESYRAQAPKKLVASLDAGKGSASAGEKSPVKSREAATNGDGKGSPSAAGKTAGKKTAGKKTAGKKTAGKKTAGKTAGKKTAGKKTAGKTAGKKTAGKTAGKKTAGKKTAGKKAARKKASRAAGAGRRKA